MYYSSLIIARYWELITKLGINHFYTTPSVIQKLMSQDKELQTLCDLPSLRIIASGRFVHNITDFNIGMMMHNFYSWRMPE